MGRMLLSRNQSFELALCAGALVALGACGGKGAGGSVRSADTETPVNTGLATLEGAPGLALPSKEELMALSASEASIQDQISESARQLEFYFTNMEIDGPADLQTEQVAADEPIDRPAESASPALETEQPRVTIAQPEQPNPDAGSKDDGGVRSSLLDLVGKPSQGKDETDTDPAQEPVQAEPEEQPDPVVSTKVELVAGEAGSQMSPAERRDALAAELASILGEMVALGQDPGASAVALASLETLLPENTDSLVDTGVLSEPELATLNAVRGLLSSMVDEGALVGPHELASELERIRIQLAEWSGIVITRAALCTRVDGFGRFETFPSYRFRAGLEHEIIVYTELENFTQRESTGPDGLTRYGIELSQRLELYHVADDLNTWNRSADTVRDESRNRLRDYYLTNRVWLPQNLGVGRYNLKVVMRDLIGERIAETIIPIEIVSQ